MSPDRPKSKKLFQEEQEVLAPGIQSIALYSQLVLDHGKGAQVFDVDDNRYIDFIAGVSVGSLGHCHPRYAKALQQQLEKITFGSFATANRIQFLKLLSSLLPGKLRKTQLYSGGAEAVESALRLAKSHTKKYEVVAFWGGFHGKTGGVLSLLGDSFKFKLGPLASGTYLTPYAHCYRCPFKMTFPSCNFHCVDHIRKKIRHETTGEISAIIVEPIQGTAGNVVPPPGYLKALQEVAQENGALLIADEMITGFGRTGKMFGFQHDGIVPDIVTIGKGMGSGFPVSGLISTDEIMASKPFSNPSYSSSSYGGNPLASAAAYVTLQTILDEKLIENSEKLGAWMLEELKGWKDRFSFIGDVRGRGLLIGVELVRDKQTQEPLSSKAGRFLFEQALERGLLMMVSASTVRINPPLVLDKATAQEGLKIMKEVFELFEKTEGFKN
ncbi:MAG: aspartate aminotransferase family protein [Deltaproteobacteria bacterium]|nr:aspartate aminotransferase family protein [Deltaproteobacteria bacterium]